MIPRLFSTLRWKRLTEMEQKGVPVNRGLVGILTIGCFAGSIAVAIYRGDFADALAAALFRTSLLLGAFWLALPTRSREAAWARISPWTLALFVGAGVLMARRPKVFLPMILALAIAAYFIRPRNRKP